MKRSGGERYDLSAFMTDEENLKMAESHKVFCSASWVIIMAAGFLLVVCIAILTCLAQPLIIQFDGWQKILPMGLASLLSLFLLMMIQKRKAQETMQTLMIRAAFRARGNEKP